MHFFGRNLKNSTKLGTITRNHRVSRAVTLLAICLLVGGVGASLQVTNSSTVGLEQPYHYGIDGIDPAKGGKITTEWIKSLSGDGKQHFFHFYAEPYTPMTGDDVLVQWWLAKLYCNAAYKDGKLDSWGATTGTDEDGNHVRPQIMPPVGGTVDAGF